MSGESGVEVAVGKVKEPIVTKSVIKILEMDEHKLSIEALCDRFGYRSEYFLKVGVTLGYVEYAHKNYGKNEITDLTN